MRSVAVALVVIAIVFIASSPPGGESRAIDRIIHRAIYEDKSISKQIISSSIYPLMSATYVDDTMEESTFVQIIYNLNVGDEDLVDMMEMYDENAPDWEQDEGIFLQNDVYDPQDNPLELEGEYYGPKNIVKRQDNYLWSGLQDQLKNLTGTNKSREIFYGTHVARYKGYGNSSTPPGMLLLETLKPMEDMTPDEIKAISFHIPGNRDSDLKKKQTTEKPKVVTELANISTTIHPLLRAKPKIPYVDNPLGRYGPFFEGSTKDKNITVRIGSTMLLDCRIGLLRDQKIVTTGWVHKRPNFAELLSLGTETHTTNSRISLNFTYPTNWRLIIKNVQRLDFGSYLCQITLDPVRMKAIHVVVTEPIARIVDDYGVPTNEDIHVTMGDILKMKCEVMDIVESENETIVWMKDDKIVLGYIRERKRTEMLEDREVVAIVNTLVLEYARFEDAGNYSCVVPGKASATVQVHVHPDPSLNGSNGIFVSTVVAVFLASLILAHLAMVAN